MNGRTALMAACAVCGLSCSLFLDTGEFTDDGARPDDAGANDSTPSGTDAAQEAALADADGGCPDGAFCDSFERTVLVGPWSGFTDNGKGCALAIDGTLGQVGSSSLKMSIPQTIDDNCQAFLHRDVFGSPKRLRLSFSLRVESELLREVHVFAIEVPSSSRALYFASFDGALALAEQQFGTGGFFDVDSVAGLEPGTWHRVVLEHDVVTKNTTVTFDGQLRLTKVTELSFATTEYKLHIGNSFSRAGAANEIWFDDVRFEQDL